MWVYFELSDELNQCRQFCPSDCLWPPQVAAYTTNWGVVTRDDPSPSTSAQTGVAGIAPPRTISKHDYNMAHHIKSIT